MKNLNESNNEQTNTVDFAAANECLENINASQKIRKYLIELYNDRRFGNACICTEITNINNYFNLVKNDLVPNSYQQLNIDNDASTLCTFIDKISVNLYHNFLARSHILRFARSLDI